MTGQRDENPDRRTFHGYPVHRISGAVPPEEVDAVLSDLGALGFTSDDIEVLRGEADEERFRDLIETPGIWGAVRRFAWSLGADLELANQAEQELSSGDALINVVVDGEMTKQQVHKVLQQHGGHFIVYFGPWTIETMS